MIKCFYLQLETCITYLKSKDTKPTITKHLTVEHLAR